jgi:hypothetical protein
LHYYPPLKSQHGSLAEPSVDSTLCWVDLDAAQGDPASSIGVLRSVTVLMDFAPTVVSRAAIRGLAATAHAADVSFYAQPLWAGWPEVLATHLARLTQAVQVSVILALPEAHAQLRQDVGHFMATLVESRQGLPSLFVVLSERPDLWAGLPGQPGYVRADADGCHHSAVRLFEFLLAMHVPHCYNAFGAEDAAELLGDDQQPSELLDALWLDATGTLVLPDPEAAAKLAACAGVALMPGQDVGLRRSRQITYAVQRLVPKEAALYMHAGGGLMSSRHVSAHWTPVTLLLASRLRTTP